MNHHPIIYRCLILAGIGLFLFALLTTGQALAQEKAPTAPLGSAFTYQGQLKDISGNPINDACDFRFILYNAEIGGAQVGPILDVPINVVGGYFTIVLDFGNGAFTGEARWLDIFVKCSGDAGYTALTPRQALTPAPNAINADLLDGLQGSAFANIGHNHWGQSWTGSGTGLSLTGGTIGLSGSGSTTGVSGTASATNGRGVSGMASAASGGAYGVRGESTSSGGFGVYGIASATAGNTFGVAGLSASGSGMGIYMSIMYSSPPWEIAWDCTSPT